VIRYLGQEYVYMSQCFWVDINSVGLWCCFLNLYLDSYPRGIAASRLWEDDVGSGLDGPDCPKCSLF